MDAAEVDIQTGIVGSDIVGTNAAKQRLQRDGSVEADASLLSSLQIGIATRCHPLRGQFVVVKTDGTNGSRRVTRLTRFRTRCLLTHQAPIGLFINVDPFHGCIPLNRNLN